MMKLRYDGPRRDTIDVLVEGQIVTHARGQVLDYPEAIALELLAEQRHTFVLVEEEAPEETPPGYPPPEETPPVRLRLRSRH